MVQKRQLSLMFSYHLHEKYSQQQQNYHFANFFLNKCHKARKIPHLTKGWLHQSQKSTGHLPHHCHPTSLHPQDMEHICKHHVKTKMSKYRFKNFRRDRNNIPSCIGPANTKMRHHVGCLLNMIHGHFKIPFLVYSGIFNSSHKYVGSNTESERQCQIGLLTYNMTQCRPEGLPCNMVHKLSLQQKIFSWQQVVTDIVLGRSYSNSITNAKRTKNIQNFRIPSMLLKQ